MQVSQRVRALLMVAPGSIGLIRRERPGELPYWVAPGGGVETTDGSLEAALQRELAEELGAEAEIESEPAFTLERQQADGRTQIEYFFRCHPLSLNLSARFGPEFADPARGVYTFELVSLDPAALQKLNIRPLELKSWLIQQGAR